jgi:molybdopterin-guanine dinucleotide biosynthesis protein A
MNAIILAGGESKRMGRNKALIDRPDGSRQIDYIAGLARECCESVFLSLRDEGSIAIDLPVIPDLHPGDGPIAALESAAASCGGPLLVLGCDLFLIDRETLAFLISHRDPSRKAICFRNRIDGRAEPLCAIYETAGLELAASALAVGKRCARKFLESLDPVMLDLPHPAALDNANTPADLSECFAKLTEGVIPKSVRILYFAKLRESRGLDEETIETLACTAAGLYEELCFRHRLPLGTDTLRVAINGEFSDWGARIAANDEVVFIPPVAGG